MLKYSTIKKKEKMLNKNKCLAWFPFIIIDEKLFVYFEKYNNNYEKKL